MQRELPRPKAHTSLAHDPMRDKLPEGDGRGMDRTIHQVVIGLGGEGFRAICSCGWRSSTSWSRDGVASARDDHRRRSRLGSAP